MYYRDMEFDIMRYGLNYSSLFMNWNKSQWHDEINTITSLRHPYIIVYLSDYQKEGDGYNLVLDFFTYLDYIAYYQFIGKRPEAMPLEYQKKTRLSTHFYMKGYKSEDKPIKGHYRLDLHVLLSNWQEYKPQTERDEEGVFIARPPYYLAYFERKDDSEKGQINSAEYLLLHYVGQYAYPQWVFDTSKSLVWEDINDTQLKLRVLNVEQGSWNVILKNDKPYLMFDIGTNSYKLDNLKDIDKQLKLHPIGTDVPALFISHWHADHYNILLGMNVDELNHIQRLVCPSTVLSLSAYNVICWFKMRDDSAMVIFHPYEGKWKNYHINDRINLYARRYVKTNPNNAGLLMFINGLENCATLPGDANYSSAKEITDDSIQQFKSKGGHYLVVPHHGGYAGSAKYTISNVVKKKHAFISFGKGNPYGHPDKKVLDSLSKDFTLVFALSHKNKTVIL